MQLQVKSHFDPMDFIDIYSAPDLVGFVPGIRELADGTNGLIC